MNFSITKEEIKKLIKMIDGNKDIISLSDFLESLLNDEQDIDYDPYEIACELYRVDDLFKVPVFVTNLIVELFLEAIEQKNDYAMNDLGALYYEGANGIKQDFKKAVYYYNMAADNGNLQSIENLGYCYYYGRDVEVDYEKAFHYYMQGAFIGSLISLYKIGDMYLNGYYVKKNEVEAFLIFNRCMQLMGDEIEIDIAGPVLLRLGNMVLNGIGTDVNYNAAYDFYGDAYECLKIMVDDGQYFYKKSMQAALEGREKAKKLVEESKLKGDWNLVK